MGHFYATTIDVPMAASCCDAMHQVDDMGIDRLMASLYDLKSRKFHLVIYQSLARAGSEKKIKEMSRAEIQVVPPGYFVTADFKPQRVRLYVDESNKVTSAPRIG
ncbi:hypothetical protein JHK87_009943 [Glycine soja]|nr:hypothetical protein JHK87_009943 [Glycine soja]